MFSLKLNNFYIKPVTGKDHGTLLVLTDENKEQVEDLLAYQETETQHVTSLKR